MAELHDIVSVLHIVRGLRDDADDDVSVTRSPTSTRRPIGISSIALP